MSGYFESATIDSAQDCAIEFPPFAHFPAAQPPDSLQRIINHLQLVKHVENGYFKETDRSPFEFEFGQDSNASSVENNSGSSIMPTESKAPEYTGKRSQSTLIYYLLTPDAPLSKMIMNASRTIHILQRGKGQYVLIYPDGTIKSFKVGFDYANGEISQWVVPGGVYKASFLLANEEFDNGLLISEVVVPGFEFVDYQAISGIEELQRLVGQEKAEELQALI